MPAPTRRPLVLWLLFMVASFSWGSSFLFIKIGLDAGLPPLTLVSYRLLVATAFLLVVARLVGARFPRDRWTLGRVVLLALIYVVVPFLLITWGEQYVGSALASILNSLPPLFTIVFGALWLADEPITVNRLAGLVLGFAGAVVLVSPNLGLEPAPATDAGLVLAGEVAILVSSAFYALGAVFIRRNLSGPSVDDPATGPRRLRSIELSIALSVSAAVMTTLLAVALEPAAWAAPVISGIAPEALLAVVWLGLFGSGIAYLAYFPVLDAWGATRSALIGYTLPVVGIVLGVIVLRERIGLVEVLGTALILGGILLVNSRFGGRRLYGRAGAAGAAAPNAATARD